MFSMSLRDLVENDCGGSNSLVKLSTHFVQDHAFKDKDLRQSTQDGRNDQSFSQTSVEELADQFFSSGVTETFKMDAILSDMRGAEGNCEEPWPATFSNETEKQEQTFDPNIWSSTENKILVQDKVIDLGYSSNWADETEQFHQNEENRTLKSRFNFDKNNAKMIKLDYNLVTETEICDNLAEPYRNMSLSSSVGVPANYFGNSFNEKPPPLVDESNDLMTTFNELLEHYNEEELLRLRSLREQNPISVNKQPATSTEQVTQSKDCGSFINLFEDNQYQPSDTWKNAYELEKQQKEQAYSFTPDNEMDSIENPLVEGKRRLENGELPTAVLCFEAAVKQNPNNAEAWQLLGTTQAENEQDQLAIKALKKCLELQPKNLSARLCLAACYTNESCNVEACSELMEWLRQNPKYSDIVNIKQVPNNELPLGYSIYTSAMYNFVKDMFIEAAQRSFESNDIDADVQNGLGVLLNLHNENDKAVDCFKAALQVRPEDARLWNRLGATLANGGRCEEAIEAYHNALQLCPGFVRARYNLGITCIHLDTYREAIEHLLEALNQQASAVSTNFKSPALSDTIWSTLRLAISMSQRADLLKAVRDRNLDLLNEEFNYSK